MTEGPRQEVATLPLCPTLRNKLLCAGFRTAADFEGVGPVDLAAEAQLSHEEALLVLKLALPMQQGRLDGACIAAGAARASCARPPPLFNSALQQAIAPQACCRQS